MGQNKFPQALNKFVFSKDLFNLIDKRANMNYHKLYSHKNILYIILEAL